MQHNLIRQLRRIMRIPLTPIVTDRIRKDQACPVEACCRYRSAHFRVPLESVFGVLVPEVKGAVAAARAEGAELRVEGDCVDGIHVCGVALVWDVVLAVAFEGKVRAGVSSVSAILRPWLHSETTGLTLHPFPPHTV